MRKIFLKDIHETSTYILRYARTISTTACHFRCFRYLQNVQYGRSSHFPHYSTQSFHIQHFFRLSIVRRKKSIFMVWERMFSAKRQANARTNKAWKPFWWCPTTTSFYLVTSACCGRESERRCSAESNRMETVKPKEEWDVINTNRKSGVKLRFTRIGSKRKEE